MSTGGRPIRFLLGVTGGWTLLRIILIWSDTDPLPRPMAAERQLPAEAAAAPLILSSIEPAPVEIAVPRILQSEGSGATVADLVQQAMVPPAAPLVEESRLDIALATASRVAGSTPVASTSMKPITLQQYAAPTLPRGKRWQASAWIVARDGGSAGVAPVSQLGGGQAGLRVDRIIGRGLALSGRVTTPLEGAGQEAAIGVAWQPQGSAIRLIAEQRIALDQGQGGPALGVSAGVSDLPLIGMVKLEAYGQAGVIARARTEGYVDGATRAFSPVAKLGRATLDLGVGAWGAKQRDADRLDLGPSVALRFPSRNGGARLQLDWRQRVAGRSRPDSGPAITLASDF